jgi:hypothetical protein
MAISDQASVCSHAIPTRRPRTRRQSSTIPCQVAGRVRHDVCPRDILFSVGCALRRSRGFILRQAEHQATQRNALLAESHGASC